MEPKKSVFVIMPFSATKFHTEAEWSEIYEDVFKPAVEACRYTCERAMPSTGSLIKSIVQKLKFSPIVLADVTDGNPNVFYELGVRHALSKRTIIVAQAAHDVPSDLGGYWFIVYGTGPTAVKRFKLEIARLIEEIERDPERSDSPVAEYLDRENLHVSSYLQKENTRKLTALCTELSGNLIAMELMVAVREAQCLAVIFHGSQAVSPIGPARGPEFAGSEPLRMTRVKLRSRRACFPTPIVQETPCQDRVPL